MIYTKEDIEKLDRVTRLKIVNAVTGIKPANLIGTISKSGQTNLAIFSSIVHLGSNPALLGFISRPSTAEVGHTLNNIKETGYYTVNHIHSKIIKNAHYTSAKFDKDISEFERCGLKEEYVNGFSAPFVLESSFKMGMKFRESIDIKVNSTTLVIGEIQTLLHSDQAMQNGDINLELTDSVGVSGLNTYYSLNKIEKHPYVRLNEVPKF